MEYILIIWALFMVVMLWLFYQNNRTYDDKIRITRLVFKQPDWMDLKDDIDAISYDRHLWLRATFRDWRKEYPKRIQDLLM